MLGTLVGAAGGADVAVGAVPVALTAMGFMGTGIAAASIAAKLMSGAAIANGGGVAAGSLVAALQPAGTGIAAASIAAKMMSAAATANGGGVAAGSLVATLQSVGVLGFSTSTKFILGSVGAAVAYFIWELGDNTSTS